MLFGPDIDSLKHDSNQKNAPVSFLIQVIQIETVQKCIGKDQETMQMCKHADTDTEMNPEF